MKLVANTMPKDGLAGWLLGRMRLTPRPRPRLELLEHITLAPRQSLALVEAEGRRFLVATSPEGASAIYALDEHRHSNLVARSNSNSRSRAGQIARVSW
jgi:flagellar biogenesis protein FliO